MKKIGQRIKQKLKRKGMERRSWSNFLKRKVLPTTMEKEKKLGQETEGKS